MSILRKLQPHNLNMRIDTISPKGYIWTKLSGCMTSDRLRFRMFPESFNKMGQNMPPALIFSALYYDNVEGWAEIPLKCSGLFSVRLHEILVENAFELRISVEGHLIQQVWTDTSLSTQITRNLCIIKDGRFSIVEAFRTKDTPEHALLGSILSENEAKAVGLDKQIIQEVDKMAFSLPHVDEFGLAPF